MKQIPFIAASIALTAFVSSCGGNKSGETDGSDSARATITETIVANANSNVIDPLSYDFSKPISPLKLNESMDAYFKQEVQLIVYPENYVDKEKFVQGQPAKGATDAKDRTLKIDFATLPDIEYTKGTPYIVKGMLSSFSLSSYDPGGTLYMKKAVLVGEAKDKKPATFNLASVSSENVYSLQDVVNSLTAWEAKNITVTGDYNGTTVSKDSKGKVISTRVDISEPGNLDVKVGCMFDADPGLTAGKTNVSVNGILSAELSFDRPYISKCTLK